MRALVTGDGGFLGSHFYRELLARGYEVFGVDVSHGQPTSLVFDGSLFRDVRFDLVVHCAAIAPHRQAIDSMVGHFTENQLLDAAMFSWAVRSRQRRLIYISSSAAYPVGLQEAPAGDRKGHRLREYDATLGPVRTYGLAARLPDLGYAAMLPDAGYGRLKLNGEAMAEEANAAGVVTSVVRPFTGYGEEQGTNWPFGAFAERARRHVDPFTIWGDGEQVRDWVHVSDVVGAALAISDAGVTSPVNICTGYGTSMRALAEVMCAEAGYQPQYDMRLDAPSGVAWRVGHPGEMQRYYQPRVALDEGIRRAIKR